MSTHDYDRQKQLENSLSLMQFDEVRVNRSSLFTILRKQVSTNYNIDFMIPYFTL